MLIVVGYWMYKKFREPLYKPGMVAQKAKADPEAFDNVELYSANSETSSSTNNKWRMPDNVEVYFFQPAKPSDRLVLALHGGPCISPEKPWELTKQIPGMYLYHARGCGHSTRVFKEFPTKGMWPGMKILEENLGIGAQVADVERIRRRLQTEHGSSHDGKIDLVGHSFGGFIAALYASEFPENVRSLTLLVPASCLTIPSKNKDEDFFGVIANKIKELGNPDHIAEYESFMKRYMDFSSLPQQTDETLAKRQNEFSIHYHRAEGKEDTQDPASVEAGLTGGMACYATFLSMGIEHDYVPICKELLSASTFPVSIVHGGDDLLPESASRTYVDLFPKGNVHFEVIPNEAHFIYDHPRVAEIVQDTMKRAG